jgi:outer membrane receptor protein involved in Fe transport
VNTPEEYRWKLTAGVFYDRSKLEEMGDFIYFGSIAQGFAQNAPFPTATSINPNPRDPGVVFFNDITRTEEQYAAFGELSYELIPDELTATFGMRYFNLDVGVVGSANSSFSNRDGIDRNEFGANLDETLADVSPLTEEDVIFKGNLTWTPTDNLLFYGTYSEGFRPGGFNRGALPTNTVPKAFRTDNVRNYELGWKTEFFDRTLRFNGAAYFVQWNEMQVSLFDPVNFGTNLTFIDNGADSEIYGVEGDVTWAPNANLLIQGSFSINDTKLTEIPDSAAVREFLAPVGSDLALAPPFQGNVRARYQWFLDEYTVHAQAAFIYTARSFSSIIADDRFRQSDWATVDLSTGVKRGRWGAELFVENLTDTRAQLFINTQDDIKRTTTNRPRTMGLRVSFDY